MRNYNKYIRACVVVISIALASCKVQTKVITEYRDRVERDTVQLVDSVFQDRIREIVTAGDTVFIHDSVFQYKYKFVYRDVKVETHDSIPYTVEVEVPVEEHGFLYKSGIALWVVIAMLVIGIVLGIVIKIAKH